MSLRLNLYFSIIFYYKLSKCLKTSPFVAFLGVPIYVILGNLPLLTYREGKKMSKQQQHWEKTRTLLFITLAIWFVFSIGIFFFGAEMEASSIRPLGYPLSYYMTCQGSLGIFVILIFWFAGRQEKIDEEFGYTEREDD